MTYTPDTTPEPEPTEPTPTEPPEPEPPAYRSLDWWKDKARTHESEAQTVAAERDQLRTRVDALQRQQIESLLTGKLHTASDFWRYGPPLAELLDDDGNVDAAKVDTVRAAMIQSAPYLAPSAAAPSSSVTSVHGGVDPDAERHTFADLLKAAAQQGRGVAEG